MFLQGVLTKLQELWILCYW